MKGTEYNVAATVNNVNACGETPFCIAIFLCSLISRCTINVRKRTANSINMIMKLLITTKASKYMKSYSNTMTNNNCNDAILRFYFL